MTAPSRCCWAKLISMMRSLIVRSEGMRAILLGFCGSRPEAHPPALTRTTAAPMTADRRNHPANTVEIVDILSSFCGTRAGAIPAVIRPRTSRES
jgi:hypothetical protein